MDNEKKREKDRQMLTDMSVFFENASARLRELLSAALQSEAELSERVGGQEALAGSMAALRRSLYAILRYTWNMNDFSFLGNDAVLKRKPIPALKLAERFFDETHMLLHDIGIELAFSAKNMPPVNVNEYAFFRILYQLLSNAVAASKPGGKISFTVQHIGSRILFRIADEGEGIASEYMDEMFSAVLSPERDFSPHGMRIGLPLARLLAEAQDGMLLAEKDAGGGTCFTLSLPVSSGAEKNELRGRDMEIDPTGGYNRPLVELADVLRNEAYRGEGEL